ncbi:Trk K+ transport system, NAD-binding component [Tindallia magadiensis]|uniref:Trk K+ transport system, NAD-binding component n=1 Tax=Tindallia magadiensis TaxID=69895 RepID=A0A1I3DUA7_9FIRM|nr:NAD-binding protein [Tindallia magadiensis]SFH90314.1 Trk K+ transport system, NAD-binding component [Tindallia magadiensis]
MDHQRLKKITRLILVLVISVIFASIFLTKFLYDHFEEGTVSYGQSLLFVFQTFTTTGYGDLLPFTSTFMNIYASILMILGLSLVFILLGTASAQWLQNHFEEIPPTNVPSNTKDHILLCGFSDLTDSLINELEESNSNFVILERRLSNVRKLMQKKKPVVYGDPSDPQALLFAGIKKAKAILAAESDETNINILLEARALTSIPILVSVENHQLTEMLQLAGATEIIDPKKILGEELARLSTAEVGPALTSEMNQLGDLYVMEFPIGMYCQFANQTIQESGIRENTGVTILGLWENGIFRMVDSPHMLLSEESMVVVLGTKDQLHQLEESMSSNLHHSNLSHQHYIVAGYGDVAKRTVALLKKRNKDVTLIVRDPVQDIPHVVGDLTSQDVLSEAGIHNASTYIISADSDDRAIFSVLAAKKLNPHLRIFVRANSHYNVHKLYRAGADFVLSVSKIAGTILSSILTEEKEKVIPDMDIHFVQHHVESSLDGKMIQDTGIFGTTGCMIIAIKSGDQVQLNPSANTILKKGDDLVLLGNSHNLDLFKSYIGPYQ